MVIKQFVHHLLFFKAGLIQRFDATSAEDRERAQGFGYTEDRCNVCLRVTQGGKVTTYLMPVKVSADDDPMKTAESNVECSCGSKAFKVNYLPYPFCGGYIKLTCIGCAASRILMDDFS